MFHPTLTGSQHNSSHCPSTTTTTASNNSINNSAARRPKNGRHNGLGVRSSGGTATATPSPTATAATSVANITAATAAATSSLEIVVRDRKGNHRLRKVTQPLIKENFKEMVKVKV